MLPFEKQKVEAHVFDRATISGLLHIRNAFGIVFLCSIFF